MTHDPINHPKHYATHPSGVEAIDICELLSFNLGNALKYVWRAKHKGNEEEDLAKSLWYIRRELRLSAFFDGRTGGIWLNVQKTLDAEGVDTTFGEFLKTMLEYNHSEDTYEDLLKNLEMFLEESSADGQQVAT